MVPKICTFLCLKLGPKSEKKEIYQIRWHRRDNKKAVCSSLKTARAISMKSGYILEHKHAESIYNTGLSILYLSRGYLHPLMDFFRDYPPLHTHTQLINFEGISQCFELPTLHKTWASQNRTLNAVFGVNAHGFSQLIKVRNLWR